MRRALVAIALVAACTGSKHPTLPPTPSSVPSVDLATRTGPPPPVRTAVWPLATKAELHAWRADPASLPWVTDRVAVAEHFLRDVLHLANARGLARCVRSCADVDVYVAGQHVGRMGMWTDTDAEPKAYSVVGVYTRDVEFSLVLGALSDPALVFGVASRPTGPLQISLSSLTGEVLATGSTATRRGDWAAVLSPTASHWGRGVLASMSHAAGRLTGLTVIGAQEQVPADPVAYVRCGRSRLAILQAEGFSAGYPGDASFGFYVANTGASACDLDGYAALRFTDAVGTVPFRIVRGSGNAYQDPGPSRVVIQPGGAAVFGVGKYRCDEGYDRMATTMWIRLPGLAATALSVRVPQCQDGPAGDLLKETALVDSPSALAR